MPLTSEIAQKMIRASQEKARDLGIAVSTAIVDTEGRLFAFGRMEGTHWLSIDAAQAKALTGALLGQEGEKLMAISPARIAAVSSLVRRALLPLESVAVLVEDGRLIAGIGCSGVGSAGATDEQDGECARAGRDVFE